MTDSNHSSRSASGRPAMRATSSAVVRYGYMPLPRMRRSSASSSAAVVARWLPPKSCAVQTSPSCTTGITTLPVMSPPMTSTRAL